jgi:hypothetical protein
LPAGPAHLDRFREADPRAVSRREGERGASSEEKQRRPISHA